MKLSSFVCAFALLATTFFAGNASAHDKLDEHTIEELAANPVMIQNAELSLDPLEQTEQIAAMIEVVFEPLEQDVPGIVDKMIAIADCESYGGNDGILMHIDTNGRLIKGATSDTGVFQVLLNTHRDHYRRYGLDPREVADNIKFARVLVEGRLARGSWAYADWVCARLV